MPARLPPGESSVHPPVAIASHFRCSSRLFLPPFARCRLGLIGHPRRARQYATPPAGARRQWQRSAIYKMGTHGTSRGLTLPACSRSPPQLRFSPPLSKVANAMSPGGARVGDRGDGNKKPPPPTPGTHPRYIPKRGSVLKGIVRGVLGLISTLIGAPANSGGHRVRPAPPGEGGDGAEQGK